jgi:Domain of unknown function (DUF1611_C) P-loop domain
MLTQGVRGPHDGAKSSGANDGPGYSPKRDETSRAPCKTRTQPDVIVLCHEAGREHVFGLLKFALPSLQDAIHLNLQLARRTMLRRCELEYLEAPGDGGARGSVCLWAIRSAVGTSSTRWSRLV